MLTLVTIDKGGTIKTVSAKSLDETNIYKKCNYRKPDNFEQQHIWNVKVKGTKYKIGCYAKAVGKANMENKYDFPPPLDNKLFYGTCGLVSFNSDDEIINFTHEKWDKIYEKLFGGFEDLGGKEQDDLDAEMDVDELKNVPKKHLTKNGYLKDGFVVDKEESEDDEEEEDEEEEDEDEDNDESEDEEDEEEEDEDSNDAESVEEVNKCLKKNINKKIKDDKESDSESYVSDNEYVSDLGDELSEEEYEYSDD